MTQSLISAQDSFALWAVVFGVVALSIWGGQQKYLNRLSGPVIAICLTIALANAGVIPHQAPAYDFVLSFVLPLGIPLLLFRANIRRIAAEAGPVLLAFLVAVVATAIGAATAAVLVSLGPEEAAISSAITAGYTGGGVNMMTVAEALGMTKNKDLMAAMFTAAIVPNNLCVIALNVIPSIPLISRMFPEYQANPTAPDIPAQADGPPHDRSSFSLFSLSAAIALSLVICTVGFALESLIGIESSGIVLIGLLAIVVANLFPRQLRSLDVAQDIGIFCMYLFFIAIAAGSNLEKMGRFSVLLMVFMIILLTVHFLVLLFVGSRLRLKLPELIVASAACLTGPPVAAAIAGARGWRELIAPGVLVGVLGYAIGTFIGLTMVALWP